MYKSVRKDVGTSTGGAALSIKKLAKEIIPGDHIILDGKPCEVKGIDLPPNKHSLRRLSFHCMTLFDDWWRIGLFYPDDVCEVPFVKRVEYLCVGADNGDDEFIMIKCGDGVLKKHVELPHLYPLRQLMWIGLKSHGEVNVTVVSAMGREQIEEVGFVRVRDQQD